MTTASRARPQRHEFAEYYGRYIDQAPDGDPVAQLREAGVALDALLRRVPESRGGHRYAEGKWSVREVIGHVIDAERIFAYRALRIARGDATPLAGFEENDYVRTAGSDARTVADLADELRAVRDTTVRLFTSFPDDAWSRRGVASGHEITVRALAWILLGHALHHARGLRENYGVG